MASKISALELRAGNQFNLEIFGSNVYSDDNGITILEPVERHLSV